MENSNLKIEYRKFNSFLKDYIRMMNRGWLFMRMTEDYPHGKVLNFEIKVSELDRELKATGTVVFSGLNDQGNQGVGFRFSFDEDSAAYLNGKIPEGIKERYGEFWGAKVCEYLQENRI